MDESSDSGYSHKSDIESSQVSTTKDSSTRQEYKWSQSDSQLPARWKVWPSKFRYRIPEHPSRWDNIVRDYSSRELTEPRDKLPALYGLAQRYHSKSNDSYLVGMWKSTLIPDLFWYPLPKSRSAHEKPRVAPSWSWMSSNGQVEFWVFHPLFEALRNAKTVGKIERFPETTHFGAISNGSLIIKGPFFKGTYHDIGENNGFVDIWQDGTFIATCWPGDRTASWVGDSYAKLICLVLAETEDRDFGLVLAEADSGKEDGCTSYTRLGIFFSRKESEAFLDASEESFSII